MQNFNYVLTKILDNGAWDPYCLKPVLREYISTNVEADDQKIMRFFDRFSRMIVVELASRELDELGLHRALESLKSNDVYNVQIKAQTQKDAMEILTRVRDICINIYVTGEYNRIELGSASYSTARGKFIMNLEITCYRSGKVI